MDLDDYMRIKHRGIQVQVERLRSDRANRDLSPLLEHMTKRAHEDGELLVFLGDNLAHDLRLGAGEIAEQLRRLEDLALIKQLDMDSGSRHCWDVGPLTFHSRDDVQGDDAAEGELARG